LYTFLEFKYAQASLPSPEDSRLVSRERLSFPILSKHTKTYQKPDEDIKSYQIILEYIQKAKVREEMLSNIRTKTDAPNQISTC
jgi:hypothetical protein